MNTDSKLYSLEGLSGNTETIVNSENWKKLLRSTCAAEHPLIFGRAIDLGKNNIVKYMISKTGNGQRFETLEIREQHLRRALDSESGNVQTVCDLYLAEPSIFNDAFLKNASDEQIERFLGCEIWRDSRGWATNNLLKMKRRDAAFLTAATIDPKHQVEIKRLVKLAKSSGPEYAALSLFLKSKLCPEPKSLDVRVLLKFLMKQRRFEEAKILSHSISLYEEMN